MTESRRSDLQNDIAIIVVWWIILAAVLLIVHLVPLLGLFLMSFIVGYSIVRTVGWGKRPR